MITVRQIERLWENRQNDRLLAELLSPRAEDGPGLRTMLTGSLAAAALALIRLDELNQAHVPLAQKLIRRLLVSQSADGGWDDPLITALCARALMTTGGQGPCIDRALAHLADLQKSEGIWPREPIRRLPVDPYVSALILYHLGGSSAFRNTVRLADAVTWFERNADRLDDETRRMWELASLKCRVRKVESLVWS
jgi:hypothetical protein